MLGHTTGTRPVTFHSTSVAFSLINPFEVIFMNDSASGYWSCFSYCEVDYNHLDSKKYGDHDYGLGLID